MLGRGTIAYQARGALIFLGQKANPVMPELVRLMGDVKARDTSFRAAEVLSTWGTPETLPSLVAVLTNQQNPARLAVLINLSKLGTNALVAVPALRKCLVDPDPSVRDEATNTLWSLAPEELPADVVWRMVPSRPQY